MWLVTNAAQPAATAAAAAPTGDLVIVHYEGKVQGTGVVFDTTRPAAGLRYRDGGLGVLRPAVLALNGSPVPGFCKGLELAILGMRVGGKKSVVVPPQLGFASSTAIAPYAIVPPGSTLEYTVELLRLSAVGPDALWSGISGCGLGGASQNLQNCGLITAAEFL